MVVGGVVFCVVVVVWRRVNDVRRVWPHEHTMQLSLRLISWVSRLSSIQRLSQKSTGMFYSCGFLELTLALWGRMSFLRVAAAPSSSWVVLLAISKESPPPDRGAAPLNRRTRREKAQSPKEESGHGSYPLSGWWRNPSHTMLM